MTKNNERRGKSRRKAGMRRLLLTYIILFFIAMIALLWLFQTFFLDDFYRATKKRDIVSAHRAAAAIDTGAEDADDEARRVSERYGVCLSVYRMTDEGGAETLISTHTLSHCAIHTTDSRGKYTLYESAKADGGEFFQYFIYDVESGVFNGADDGDTRDSQEISMVYVTVSPRIDGSDLMIALNSIITPLTATVETIYVQLGAFTALFAVAAAFFVYFISRRFTAPIATLTRSAVRFAEGDMDVDMRVDGYEEIRALSETLNYAREELSKNDKLRRELLANVSHDLRTPLTMIIGYGEMMRDIPGESTPENAANIVSEAERLKTLVSELLELSRLQTGTAELRSAPFSITALLGDMVTRHGDLLRREGYDFEFITDGSDAVVESDCARVEQVARNLISNAVRHAGEDKKVVVRQIVADEWVTVAVTDHGEGIPTDKLEDIWERYYKINSAHARGSGTGLGLSIVKATMDQLGGHYGVESAVGKGSTFWFALRTHL